MCNKAPESNNKYYFQIDPLLPWTRNFLSDCGEGGCGRAIIIIIILITIIIIIIIIIYIITIVMITIIIISSSSSNSSIMIVVVGITACSNLCGKLFRICIKTKSAPRLHEVLVY